MDTIMQDSPELRLRTAEHRSQEALSSFGQTVPMRLLVVDDEVRLAEALSRALRAEHFDVDVVHDGNDAMWHAQQVEYAAIVLDIMLPGKNGYEVCRDLRAAGNTTPILMLTAKDGEYDEAEALDTGADDYLRKPFSLVVLLARLRAMLRRGPSHTPDTIEVGDLVIDRGQLTCTRSGEQADHPDASRTGGARTPGAPSARRGVEVVVARRGVGARLRR